MDDQKSKFKLTPVLLNLSKDPLRSQLYIRTTLIVHKAYNLSLHFPRLCFSVSLSFSFLEPKKGKLKQKDSANVMALRKRRERESKKTRDRVDRNERKAQIEAPPGSSSVWGCVFDKKKKKNPSSVHIRRDPDGQMLLKFDRVTKQ